MTTPAEREPRGTPAQEAAYQIYGSFFLTPAEPMARGPFNHIVAIIQAAIDEATADLRAEVEALKEDRKIRGHLGDLGKLLGYRAGFYDEKGNS